MKGWLLKQGIKTHIVVLAFLTIYPIHITI